MRPDRKPGERTLRASILLSAPGPLVMGLGLIVGRSSTQLADFIRRTAELVAMIVSWLVFRSLNPDIQPNAAHRQRLERIASNGVGAAMGISGVAMLLFALLSGQAEKGNVIPGLVIAILGVTTNVWFWQRYRRLDRACPDAIMALQARLYGAKSFVDACVTIALAFVAIAPQAPATRYADMAGSAIVAFYLIANGVATLRSGSTRTEAV